ncbi:MAG: hypothetical protein JKP90_00255 [Desulfofustis sp. PB-SRB1]|nr:hypothetical protein [Desulfofustis sp. PB-SRB1]
MSYRTFFGLSAEPFRADLALEQVLTPRNCSASSNASTMSCVWAPSCLSPAKSAPANQPPCATAVERFITLGTTLWVTASAGSILELYRQLLAELTSLPHRPHGPY